MKNLLFKVRYHTTEFMFNKYAYPQVLGERISKVVLKNYLPVNPSIIDCGAHDGSDTVSLAKLFNKGNVYAFEPVDELYQRLSLNTKKYNNIHCFQLALADKNGQQDFFVSEGASDGSSSLLEPAVHLTDHPDVLFDKKISVTTNTLDHWAETNKIRKIDMLWLDMQGYEMNMLMASSKILQTVSVIHTEVSTRETYKGVAQYDQFRTFLQTHGFKPVIEAIPKGWAMGNVLFVKNK